MRDLDYNGQQNLNDLDHNHNLDRGRISSLSQLDIDDSQVLLGSHSHSSSPQPHRGSGWHIGPFNLNFGRSNRYRSGRSSAAPTPMSDHDHPSAPKGRKVMFISAVFVGLARYVLCRWRSNGDASAVVDRLPSSRFLDSCDSDNNSGSNYVYSGTSSPTCVDDAVNAVTTIHLHFPL